MKRSYLIASAILLLIILWMVSGLFKTAPEKQPANAETAQGVTRVEVADYQAEPMLREVVVQGQTLARHQLTLKTRLDGGVQELLVDKGQAVEQGQKLFRLAAEERPRQLEQARALVAQRELEYQAAKSLKDKGLQAERQLAEAETLLRNARVALKQAELNMAHLTLRAPFAGRIQDRHVEPGDYLQKGAPTFTLVALDPLVIRGDVAESEVGRLEAGMAATAELSNGHELVGKLTYIAPVAESSTRTFAVEMEATNPGALQRGGMSATLRIPLAAVMAHKVSPALLSLSDAGVLGLKSVDAQNTVRFHPVEILKSARDGIWVGGLPEQARLISVGQGFVRAGDQVQVVEGDGLPSSSVLQ